MTRSIGTDSSGKTVTGVSAMSPPPPESPMRETATMEWESQSATMTMMATPICTSLAMERMSSTTTMATGRSPT